MDMSYKSLIHVFQVEYINNKTGNLRLFHSAGIIKKVKEINRPNQISEHGEQKNLHHIEGR